MSVGNKETLRNLLKDASTVRFIEPVPYELPETQEEEIEEATS